jgi:hypothetical protein
MILWFGFALTGWPGVAHGGSIATFFIEGLGKVVNFANNGMYSTIIYIQNLC